ncbi:MAG: phasin family protein [Desulfobacterales bacterium]|nr:phasin family protein [Desulfobacteraceae bacterium]MDY0310904.1 phasin family protein [Desulfobacterales bacterium]
MVESNDSFNPAESLKKLVIMGLGAGLMAKDEMEKMGREFSKKFEMGEKDAKKFMDDLEQRYEKAQKKLDKRVEEMVHDFLKKADIVTNDDLKALKKEIRELKKAVSEGTDAKEE